MLLEREYKNMETGLLKKLCKNEKLKGYSKLKKKELFDQFNRILAVKIIQRHFRTHFYKNATDHITLEPISFPCFIYKTKSGKHYFYNHDSIIKYIMKTGNTKDPMTREEYSDNDLIRLDTEAKLHYPDIKYRSTYKIKKNLSYARRIKNRENEILSFQMRMDELKELILFINTSDMLNWDLGNEPIFIENIEYPSMDSFIRSVIHELKRVILNLRSYDSYSAELFKTDLLKLIEQSQLLELLKNI